MKAVALLSGGLDSVVATAAAARSGEVVLTLTFDYGQRSAENEIAAARASARALRIAWRKVALPWMADLLPQAMRRGGRKRLPEPASADLSADLDDAKRSAEAARAVWVPNRNGVFVNVAAAFAEALGADAVVAGFNREEAAAFPDNSEEFMARAEAALSLSTLSRVRVVSPTSGLTKTGIVRLGLEVGAPVRHVWSCYGGGRAMCGACESCARLVRALREAGVPPGAGEWPKALPRRR